MPAVPSQTLAVLVRAVEALASVPAPAPDTRENIVPFRVSLAL